MRTFENMYGKEEGLLYETMGEVETNLFTQGLYEFEPPLKEFKDAVISKTGKTKLYTKYIELFPPDGFVKLRKGEYQAVIHYRDGKTSAGNFGVKDEKIQPHDKYWKNVGNKVKFIRIYAMSTMGTRYSYPPPPPPYKRPLDVPPIPYTPPTPNDLEATKCFIATATYGTSMMHEIDTLRAFRDNSLEPKFIGKLFINWYYKISPSIAKFIIINEKLRTITRAMLNPIIKLFKKEIILLINFLEIKWQFYNLKQKEYKQVNQYRDRWKYDYC